jgi:hypothetical protein
MRTETTTRTLYTFDELGDKAKEKALEEYRDINVSYDWWDFIYEDAETVGLKIDGFDLDRRRHATGKFIESAFDCASKIIKEHGEMCETYKTAKAFLSDWSELVTKYSDGINTDEVAEDNDYEFDQEADEMESEFLKSILEDFSIMLQNESEYIVSDEAVREAIEANEYEFTEEGRKA